MHRSLFNEIRMKRLAFARRPRRRAAAPPGRSKHRRPRRAPEADRGDLGRPVLRRPVRRISRHSSEGFARLLSGAVFPHGLSEPCRDRDLPRPFDDPDRRPPRTPASSPMTGPTSARRARGQDRLLRRGRERAGQHLENYTVSDKHLKVPTLGEWMKLADPRARVVVGRGQGPFGGDDGRATRSTRSGGGTARRRSFPMPAAPTGDGHARQRRDAARSPRRRSRSTRPHSARHDSRSIPAAASTVGDGRFRARPPATPRAFRASPEFDDAILALGAGLATDMKLGQGARPTC
jgi:hypothetical protein